MQPPLFGRTVERAFDDALARAEQALEAEGFGVLCRIDVRAKLGEKLGIDFPPYTILGACLPAMAHRALTAEPEVGILLPCNVVVRAVEGGTRVEVVNTGSMVELFPRADLAEVAREVGRRLDSVLRSV